MFDSATLWEGRGAIRRWCSWRSLGPAVRGVQPRDGQIGEVAEHAIDAGGEQCALKIVEGAGPGGETVAAECVGMDDEADGVGLLDKTGRLS